MARQDVGFKGILHHDAAPGVALIIAAALALLFDNTPLAGLYDGLFKETYLTVGLGASSQPLSLFDINKPLLLWINDGLMVIFFFYVGLEIKREVITGRLSSFKSAMLPLAAAVGGVVAPALIYVGLNADNPEGMRGWAIPAATDIAFAVGILALLGARAPTALKVFLLALAIIDDLAAIIIIALFYTENLSVVSLSVGLVGAAVLFAFNRFKISNLGPYILVGVIMWAAVLKSGVHATLAGVVIAMFIPLRHFQKPEISPLENVEHALKPWVYFLVMPVFAFANAGVPLSVLTPENLAGPIPLGIAMGLFFGKQIGVFLLAWLAVQFRLAALPDSLTWRHIYGAACLAGVGFTMSLFIGTLAFEDPAMQNAVRAGVLSGSFFSGVVGFLVLRFAAPSPRTAAAPQPA